MKNLNSKSPFFDGLKSLMIGLLILIISVETQAAEACKVVEDGAVLELRKVPSVFNVKELSKKELTNLSTFKPWDATRGQLNPEVQVNDFLPHSYLSKLQASGYKTFIRSTYVAASKSLNKEGVPKRGEGTKVEIMAQNRQ